ncbi:putative MO25-like protein, partial [Tanacetum coccineum]
ARKDATQIVANLQRQQVHSRLIACDYLEANIDLMDISASGYENPDMALHYGAMLRECIRHQSVARYVLESQHMKKFFDFIQLPNFDIVADAAATFKVIDELVNHRDWAGLHVADNSCFHYRTKWAIDDMNKTVGTARRKGPIKRHEELSDMRIAKSKHA